MSERDALPLRRDLSRRDGLRVLIGSLMLGSVLASGTAAAATFTVDSTGDGAAVGSTSDGVCDAQVGPGVVCTLRAAIQEANGTAGADTIVFSIPGAGVHTISPASLLPTITQAVTIDGTTQGGYVAGGLHVIEINGSSGGGAFALDVGFGVSVTIRGLCIDQFPTAIRLSGSTNIVAGNFLGTDPTGTLSGRGNGVGIYIRSNFNQIDGTTAAGRNVISGNTVDGIQIDGAGGGTGGDNNVVKGNYIGVDATGTAALGNSGQGISDFNGASSNTIGGTTPGDGNVISANNNGIAINNATTTGNVVQGNLIGTDSSGALALGNLNRGITFDQDSKNNTIGGGGAGNTIAHNGSNGVWMGGALTTGNAILGNAIYANGAIGIDLAANGVDVNDTGDGDTGPNNFQNHPVLSAALTNSAGSANFAGSLNSAASTNYRIELFASSVADPSGFGEGERYLGATNVATDVTGNVLFAVSLAAALGAGESVSATATNLTTNDTSEFGNVVVATGSLVVTTTSDTVDGDTSSVANLIATPGADNRISLREAILATNATAGTDTVGFAIPLTDPNHFYYKDDALAGSLSIVQATTLADVSTPSSPVITSYDSDYPAGLAHSWYRIQPAGALPNITDTLLLDGSTEPLALTGAPAIELNGALAGATTGLTLTGAASSGSTIKALDVDQWGANAIRCLASSSNNVVVGNYLGTGPAGKLSNGNAVGVFLSTSGNRIGGTTVAERNVISANSVDGLQISTATATGNLVQGNYIGVDVTGTAALGNTNTGVAIYAGAANTTVGGSASARNLISANGLYGVGLSATTGNVIASNFIGTNAAGTAALGNTQHGVRIASASSGNTVGGTTPAVRNVISGNAGQGVRIDGAGTVNNVIEGNFIGTNAVGAAGIANGTGGIAITNSAATNTIGGVAGGASNVIAYNVSYGIDLGAAAGTGNSILSNSIFGNTALGIDLLNDGVTANDVLDADTGPNDLLNFPFITSVQDSGGTLTAYFKLDVPAGSYRIEFFANPSGADGSGNGEGEVLVGATNVTHAGGGSANFTHTFAGVAGNVITGTTTLCTDGATCSLFGDTSEFSNAFTAVPTAVTLTSFTAVGRDGAVDLAWETASELRNLGFHLYRSTSPTGGFERITGALIAGLGSSPTGRQYRYRDSALENARTYYYELEDVETDGKSTLHGPVSATPDERATDTSDDGRVVHGDPSNVSLRILDRSSNGVTLELVTGGFFATASGDGTFRLEVPGFDGLESATPGSPALPLKRTWLDAVAGRGAKITSVHALDVTSLSGLEPESAGAPELEALPGGTVRARSRHVRTRSARRGAGIVPEAEARIVETGYQGEVERALVELAPLRWDSGSRNLLWTRRLEVKLTFTGVDSSARVRRGSRRGRQVGQKLATRIATTRPGLYRVLFEDVFPARSASWPATSLRLSRLGDTVAFHLEPDADRYGPGSALYFLSPGAAANPDGREAVFELEADSGGGSMPVMDASPSGPPVGAYLCRKEWEENRYYQAGLLDAPSRWLWDVVLSPSTKDFPFALGAIADGESTLEVYLQGASDFQAAPDHHVRVLVNQELVGESRWDGKIAMSLRIPLVSGTLREGDNVLSIENVGDTTATYSMVFLDRFAVTYPRPTIQEAGALEGTFRESGTVTVAGLSPGSLVLKTSPQATWLRGANETAAGVSFHAESGSSYLVVSPGAALVPTIRKPSSSSGLRDLRNRADYLVIGPRAFLAEAAPLVERRRSQGLVSRAVAIEDVFDEFGYGEARPEALKDFLEYAYHNWRGPAVRYVVLLGDATYDPKDYLQTGVVNQVPAYMRKTSYLWTASDPSYAEVNGDDELPDVALGRLPAANVDEARRLVEKILAYEQDGQSLTGPAILVADNADDAGNFEADSDEIALSLSLSLTNRAVTKIYLSQVGAAGMKSSIEEAFDDGASLLSYVGHGGIGLWASENVFATGDVDALRAQSRQPIVMTMSCLNGYFHFPYFDSLAEALVKAGGRGAIAAVSPSGLSLDGPAHIYHRALVEEIVSGRHQRLGDAILAAQRDYADSGVFLELLEIYNLFGDPALVLR
jgi:CSLREA domain-containing protein